MPGRLGLAPDTCRPEEISGPGCTTRGENEYLKSREEVGGAGGHTKSLLGQEVKGVMEVKGRMEVAGWGGGGGGW